MISLLLAGVGSYAFLLSVAPLRFSKHQSDFATMNRVLWESAAPDASVIYYGNNLPSYKDTIYFNNFEHPEYQTVQYVDFDQERFRGKLDESHDKYVVTQTQNYYDLRRSAYPYGRILFPVFEWDGYILLEAKGNTRWFNPRRDGETQHSLPVETGTSVEALVALARDGVVETGPLLLKYLEEGDERTVSTAARGLSFLRYEGALPALKGCVANNEPGTSVYQSAAWALACLRDPAAVPFLKELYSRDPLYPVGQPRKGSQAEIPEYNNIRTAFLLLETNREVGQEVILENLVDFVRLLQARGTEISVNIRRLFILYRLGNETAFDMLGKLIDDKDILKKRIGVHLLAKPPGEITRLSVREMDRARSMLRGIADGEDNPSEVRRLAGQILARYHKDAWVGW